MTFEYDCCIIFVCPSVIHCAASSSKLVTQHVFYHDAQVPTCILNSGFTTIARQKDQPTQIKQLWYLSPLETVLFFCCCCSLNRLDGFLFIWDDHFLVPIPCSVWRIWTDNNSFHFFIVRFYLSSLTIAIGIMM